MINRLDCKAQILELADDLLPYLGKDGRLGNIPKMLERYAPLSLVKMIDLMLNSKNDKVQSEMAKTIAFMAGHKPPEKSINLSGNIDNMTEAQLNSYLKAAFEVMPEKEKMKLIELIKDENGEYKEPSKVDLKKIPITEF